MTAARPAPLKRAALALLAAALLAAPAFAEAVADPPQADRGPLICGAATIHTEAAAEPGMVLHSSAFDPLWVEAMVGAGCTQTQVGCNTCSVTESGKTICGVASCAVETPATVSASCSWSIADFKCRQWRDDSRIHEGGWAQDSHPDRPPTVVQAD